MLTEMSCTVHSVLLSHKDVRKPVCRKRSHSQQNYTQNGFDTVSQPRKKEALGVGVWRWWSSIIISPIILVRPPIVGVAISCVTTTSEMTRCDIRRRITTTATTIATWSISITRWSRVSIIITEKSYSLKQNS